VWSQSSWRKAYASVPWRTFNTDARCDLVLRGSGLTLHHAILATRERHKRLVEAFSLCYTGCMNDEQLDDLKQFIDARISRSEQRMSTEFKQQLQITNQKIDDGLAGVGEAIEQINDRRSRSGRLAEQA
jgi:hypothetical protein